MRALQADEAAITTATATATATATGVEAAKVPLVIQAFFDKVLECSAGCDWSPDMYDCISFRPTAGGNKPSPADFHNADDINADGTQGPPGEVTTAQLDSAIATTPRNPSTLQPMSIYFSDPPTQSELLQVQDKYNELLTALIRP
jgi:hypothetical protein